MVDGRVVALSGTTGVRTRAARPYVIRGEIESANPKSKIQNPKSTSRRQLDFEPRPVGMVVVNGDASVVIVDDAVNNGQPEASAATFG